MFKKKHKNVWQMKCKVIWSIYFKSILKHALWKEYGRENKKLWFQVNGIKVTRLLNRSLFTLQEQNKNDKNPKHST